MEQRGMVKSGCYHNQCRMLCFRQQNSAKVCHRVRASRSALLANAPLSLVNSDPSRSLTSSDALAKLVVVELHEYASRLISELCQHGALILVEVIAGRVRSKEQGRSSGTGTLYAPRSPLIDRPCSP